MADVAGSQEVIVFYLAVEGDRVSGDLVQATTRVLKASEATIKGNQIAFKFLLETGNRTIAFAGTLKSDAIEFVRTVQVHEGGVPGGRGLFGAGGAPSFVARRMSD